MTVPENLREYLRTIGRKGGLRGGKRGGKARMAQLTPAQRKALARKAILSRWRKAKKKTGRVRRPAG